jgi:hypothetical protein
MRIYREVTTKQCKLCGCPMEWVALKSPFMDDGEFECTNPLFIEGTDYKVCKNSEDVAHKLQKREMRLAWRDYGS